MKRTFGLFSHYSKWMPRFSDKTFPLCVEAKKAFHGFKKDIENSFVQSIDESLSLELECDASDIAIAAVLNQAGRRVAFPRIFHGSELK